MILRILSVLKLLRLALATVYKRIVIHRTVDIVGDVGIIG